MSVPLCSHASSLCPPLCSFVPLPQSSSISPCPGSPLLLLLSLTLALSLSPGSLVNSCLSSLAGPSLVFVPSRSCNRARGKHCGLESQIVEGLCSRPSWRQLCSSLGAAWLKASLGRALLAEFLAMWGSLVSRLLVAGSHECSLLCSMPSVSCVIKP